MDDNDNDNGHSPRGTSQDISQDTFRALLRAQRVWDTDGSPLPAFDPATAPGDPLPLFHRWFAQAVAAHQPEPHTMTLATADERGRPDVRTLMLHDADDQGWHFASHTTSRKGRQLAARPEAALGFYWPAQARAVRLRGTVRTAPPRDAAADLRARSTGALAAALVGHQSEVLGSVRELAEANRTAWDRARHDPTAEAPTWTEYVLVPDEVEFFQGEEHRRHVRLRYRRPVQEAPAGTWARELLWP
ncbi:pyridoxal 5'-phosphate synthase [Streptomyces sp. NPDC101062]|uniref:pyridoxine/pyridoxamine 5'-phosphate oxidase n=1 Tax=unclassified Streptomyces TaxID=2593676 RepID=UPI00381692D3